MKLQVGVILFLVFLSTGSLLASFISPTHHLTLSGIETRQPDAKGDWTELVIPLKRAGNLFLVEATVDSITGDFVLDTGAPYLILNKTYFRQLANGNDVFSAGVNGENSIASRSTIPKISIDKMWYEEVDADIADLRHIENEREFKLLGLLGANLFSSFLVKLDFTNRQLVLTRLDASGEPVVAESDSLLAKRLPDLQLGFKWCDNKIFLPVVVGGQKMNWMLDTGAESNVVDASAGKKVMRDFIVMRRVQLTGSTGSKQEVLMGIMPQMAVGAVSFDMQQTLVTGMAELNETCSIYIDGILGYTFLSQGVFTLNFIKKEFCFYLYNNK